MELTPSVVEISSQNKLYDEMVSNYKKFQDGLKKNLKTLRSELGNIKMNNYSMYWLSLVNSSVKDPSNLTKLIIKSERT